MPLTGCEKFKIADAAGDFLVFIRGTVTRIAYIRCFLSWGEQHRPIPNHSTPQHVASPCSWQARPRSPSQGEGPQMSTGSEGGVRPGLVLLHLRRLARALEPDLRVEMR